MEKSQNGDDIWIYLHIKYHRYKLWKLFIKYDMYSFSLMPKSGCYLKIYRKSLKYNWCFCFGFNTWRANKRYKEVPHSNRNNNQLLWPFQNVMIRSWKKLSNILMTLNRRAHCFCFCWLKMEQTRTPNYNYHLKQTKSIE